jgi:hypothetical protein
MKVKISLRFRGREMVHQEFGRDVMTRFIKELEPFGHAIESPKLIGKSIHAMVNPLPRNKRAPNPNANPVTDQDDDAPETPDQDDETSAPTPEVEAGSTSPAAPPTESDDGFANNPFADLEKKLPPTPPPPA